MDELSSKEIQTQTSGFLSIDHAKLSNVLREIGYPQEVSSVDIQVHNSQKTLGEIGAIGSIDPEHNVVVFNTDALIRTIHRLNKPRTKDKKDNLIWMAESLNPSNWSYYFLKKPYRSFYTKEMVQEMKTDPNSKDRVVVEASKRWAAIVIAHEIEHLNNRIVKRALPYAMLVATGILTTFISEPLGGDLDQPLPWLRLAGVVLFSAFSGLYGKSLDEKASCEAMDKNWKKIAEAINIDGKLLLQEVIKFGKVSA